MENIDLFINFVEAHRYTGYAILYFSMIFEGELFLLAAGVLSHLGAFDIIDVFIFSFLGVLTSDIVWYWAGRFFKKRYPEQRIIRFVERRVKRVFPSIEKNPFRLVFASKFLYGFNHSTIFILGFLKTEFWHFFRVQIKASLLWVVVFLALGYFFGYTAIHITRKINKFALVILVLFLLFFIIERIIDYVVALKAEKRIK